MGCFSMYNKMFLPDALLILLRKSVMREKQKVSDLHVIHIPAEDLAVTKLYLHVNFVSMAKKKLYKDMPP